MHEGILVYHDKNVHHSNTECYSQNPGPCNKGKGQTYGQRSDARVKMCSWTI